MVDLHSGQVSGGNLLASCASTAIYTLKPEWRTTNRDSFTNAEGAHRRCATLAALLSSVYPNVGIGQTVRMSVFAFLFVLG